MPTTEVDELAAFVVEAAFEDLSGDARRELTHRILDSLGCAVGALDAEPVRAVRRYVEAEGGAERATLIGGGASSPKHAALYNGFLVRYLDFNDSYLAEGETCHPSDNMGAVLAAAEDADASGEELLTALAVAYQVQCRLSDEAPVRAKGFDHVTQGAYSVACGVAKALGLDVEETANAAAISGTAFNALRVTRTGELSHWKGLAFPNTAFSATHATYLAREGITGPPEVFEGNKGFEWSIAGDFEIDWGAEDLERVRRTILKRYNAEVHSQSTLEAVLDLRTEHDLDGSEVSSVEIGTFDVAHDIIGGGEEGDKTTVTTKEEADHSLPYMVAVAILDGEVGPAQYASDRIAADDVQDLLQRVEIRQVDDLSGAFPEAMPTRVEIALDDGSVLEADRKDYEGFHTRPMDRGTVEAKFRGLVSDRIGEELADEIVETVETVAARDVADLTETLAKVPREGSA